MHFNQCHGHRHPLSGSLGHPQCEHTQQLGLSQLSKIQSKIAGRGGCHSHGARHPTIYLSLARRVILCTKRVCTTRVIHTVCRRFAVENSTWTLKTGYSKGRNTLLVKPRVTGTVVFFPSLTWNWVALTSSRALETTRPLPLPGMLVDAVCSVRIN